jgi:hypothetical protein
MAHIADAPAGRVIWLRGVAQLMAQMNLVVVRGNSRKDFPTFLNCPMILDLGHFAAFRPQLSVSLSCYTAYRSHEEIGNVARNSSNRRCRAGSRPDRHHYHASQKQEENGG